MSFPLQELDAALTRPVLVYGSPPPHGRDLDLFARTAEAAALAAALPAAGFEQLAGSWVRWTSTGPQVVDVRPEQAWGLPDDEVAALFAEALPVPGSSRLVRPSPAHVLLLLARRTASGTGGLDDKRRARLAAALAEDPRAWERAAGRAAAWGAVQALEVLRRAAAGRPVSRRSRADALVERHVAAGRGRLAARAAAWRAVARRPRRGRVVAVCGLDGAGKSSQSADLAALLDQLGHPAVTQWTRLSYDPAVAAIGGAAKSVIRAVVPRLGQSPQVVPADVDPSRVRAPEQQLRQRSPYLTAAWATVVAVSNGVAQRRATRTRLRSGYVVVSDRWTLDSAVHLRYRYGERRSFAPQVRIIQVLSPRPLRTFFLDIPAEVAYARKDDHYDVGQLSRQHRLYVQEWERAGAHRLDGQRPRAELAREIALAVVPALLARPRRLPALRRAR